MAYDYFAGFPIAGQTREFLVTFASESDLDALARAQAIVYSCERDLDQLQTWFRTDFRAGSPYGIWVHVNSSSGGGGSNFGYDDSESSRIIVSGTYAPSPPVPNQGTIRDEYGNLIFVAELAEILMDFTGYGWNRGASAGEALSIVLATELHPLGYYGSGRGPRVNQWLNLNPRPDWVSATEATDSNIVSYGCGVLFLYYLRYQNGIDYTTIVTAGGATLAETYAKIFPGPASNAFGGFAVTLQAHAPAGTPVTVARDNIFPLNDSHNRALTLIELTSSSSDAGPAFGTRAVTRKAGIFCPERDYTYTTELNRVTESFKAAARGFLQATFTWKIGDVLLNVHAKVANATVPVTVTDTALDAVVPVPGFLTIDYVISDTANGSVLQIRNQDFPGNVELDVSVSAVEALAPGDAAIGRDLVSGLALFDYRLDPQWGIDLLRCNPQPILEIDQYVAEISDWVLVLLNTPDPAPEQILQVGVLVQALEQSVLAATGGSSAWVRSIGAPLATLRAARLAANPEQVQRLTRPDGAPILFREGGSGSSSHHHHHRHHHRPHHCSEDLDSSSPGSAASTNSDAP